MISHLIRMDKINRSFTSLTLHHERVVQRIRNFLVLLVTFFFLKTPTASTNLLELGGITIKYLLILRKVLIKC